MNQPNQPNRPNHPNHPNHPKEGVYLDAALGVIGEQLDERIDELSRRRRTRHRVGAAALTLVAIAGGSVGAYALTSASAAPTASIASPVVSHEVTCVGGTDPDAAYFTMTFQAADPEQLDLAAVCGQARATLIDDPATVSAATPSELIALAAGYVDDATVTTASFAAATQPATGWFVPCPRDGATLVLTVDHRPAHATERALLCAGSAP